MSERLTPERIAKIREWSARVPKGARWTNSMVYVAALLAELDAVTKERDDLAVAAKRVIEVVEKCDVIQRGSYSGMNFITNRDGRIR